MRALFLILPMLFLFGTAHGSDDTNMDLFSLYEADIEAPMSAEADAEIEADLRRHRYLCLARDRRGRYYMGLRPSLQFARRRAYRKCRRFSRQHCRIVWCSRVR